MESFAPRARPRSRAWIGPAALAALATFVSIGCVGPTPIKDQAMPTFLETMEELSLSYQVDREIGTLLLPPATAGSGTLTYSLTPAIPGLTFDGNVRTLIRRPRSASTTWPTGRWTRTTTPPRSSSPSPSRPRPSSGPWCPRSPPATPTAGCASWLPEPAGGPAVAVAGNPVVTAGGSFFLNVATDGAADTLLVSIGGESFVLRDRPRPPDRTAPVRPRPGPRSVLPAGHGGG